MNKQRLSRWRWRWRFSVQTAVQGGPHRAIRRRRRRCLGDVSELSGKVRARSVIGPFGVFVDCGGGGGGRSDGRWIQVAAAVRESAVLHVLRAAGQRCSSRRAYTGYQRR